MQTVLTEKVKTAISLFMRTDRMHKGMFSKKAKSLGVHRMAHEILRTADKEPHITQKRLAELLEVSSAAVTGAVKKLEAEGLLIRSGREGDDRVKEISLTDKGRELLYKTRISFAGIDAAMFSNFSDEELSSFISCLEKLQSNLSAMDNKLIEIPQISEKDVKAIRGFGKEAK